MEKRNIDVEQLLERSAARGAARRAAAHALAEAVGQMNDGLEECCKAYWRRRTRIIAVAFILVNAATALLAMLAFRRPDADGILSLALAALIGVALLMGSLVVYRCSARPVSFSPTPLRQAALFSLTALLMANFALASPLGDGYSIASSDRAEAVAAVDAITHRL